MRHISSIEERTLESLAWEESSPLLVLLDDKSNPAAVAQNLFGPQGIVIFFLFLFIWRDLFDIMHVFK